MHMIVRDKALSQTFCTKTYTLVYKLSKPCDQLPFACLKARYRAWLANRKLNDQRTNEKQVPSFVRPNHESPYFLEKACLAKS